MINPGTITPLVAIQCITYNQEKYIRDALEGFIMQKTNFPFVAIVHDDASTDKTAEIVKEYADKYPDIIKPIFETENQYSKRDGSLRRIMNDATNQTGAKYIALCEGDDYWTDPFKLQKQVDFMENHPNYSMCFHTVERFNDRTQQSEGFTYRYPTNQTVLPEDIILKGGAWCPTCSIVYRTELMRTYPDFCKRCVVGDYPLQMYLSLVGNVYYFIFRGGGI